MVHYILIYEVYTLNFYLYKDIRIKIRNKKMRTENDTEFHVIWKEKQTIKYKYKITEFLGRLFTTFPEEHPEIDSSTAVNQCLVFSLI